jgi:hypothetical protein
MSKLAEWDRTADNLRTVITCGRSAGHLNPLFNAARVVPAGLP